jgi:biotin transport system permease protein
MKGGMTGGIQGGSLFSYSPGHSLLHRAPALVKVAALLALSVAAFFAPPEATAAATPLLLGAALLCGIPLKAALSDLKPALYYAFFLYATAVAAPVMGAVTAAVTGNAGAPFSAALLPPAATVAVMVRLAALLQVSSLLFRTTTTVALKNAIAAVCPPLAVPLALFLGFIPALFQEWTRLDRAFRARGGAPRSKAQVLLPALMALAFYQADQKARALAAREGP